MRKRPHLSAVSAPDALSLGELETLARGWLLDCEIRQISPRTLSSRTSLAEKFLWQLERQGATVCGPNELKSFFLYLNRGHKEPGGRWGNPREVNPLKPGTIVSYFNILRSMFAYFVESEDLEVSPMARMKPPLDRPDDIVTFTPEQVSALLKAARAALTPRRDVAIIYLLLDTGIRASELAGLRVRDIDMTSRALSVEGKGGKRRSVPFGKTATKALWVYQRHVKADQDNNPDAPLFFGLRGHTPGSALTRSGVGEVVRKAGIAAGLDSVRCSPHTFRHTFAVEFLRNGGNQFALMRLLGHEDLTMTSRYVKLAAADVEKQHRAASPADRMKLR